MKRKPQGRSHLPPVTSSFRLHAKAGNLPPVPHRYPSGWPLRRKSPASLIFPAGLIGLVLALSTILIFGIVIRGPDTHANLWNTVRPGYSRTDIGYVASEAGPAMASLPLAAPVPAVAGAPAPSTESPPEPAPNSPPDATAAGVSFSKDILPLLKGNCIACHGSSLAIKGISVSSYDSLTDTSSHAPLIIPGKPEESLLMDVLLNRKGVLMPPLGALPGDRISVIERWIEQGANNN